MEVGGILGESDLVCTFGDCAVHEGVSFVGVWFGFDEEGYEGGEEPGEESEAGGEEEDENMDDGEEDDDEDMDDGEEDEEEDEDDNQHEELRKRVSGTRGVPCDRCSSDNTSKSRNYCSRRMSPGGAPKCKRCEKNGWACTWARYG